jgi:uncharacterized membrane protein YphA (DoxX/SURF4 family)
VSASNRAAWAVVWVLKGLIALVFLSAAAAKLTGAPMMVAEFNLIGLGQGFRLFTGLIEVCAAVLLLVPGTSPVGAALLFCVSFGALIAQATRLHGDVVHTVVFMALTALLVWLGRSRLPVLGKPVAA